MESSDLPPRMELRQRHRQAAMATKPATVAEVELPPMEEKDKFEIRAAVERREALRGFLAFTIFILLALGIPGYFIYRWTPFFSFQNVRCRLTDRYLWPDASARESETAYEKFFHDPPLFGTEAFQKTFLWGTYDPSQIFAMQTLSAKPVTFGIAWYDAEGRFPLRHRTALLHNRVASLKSRKPGSETDVLRVEWVAHDGHHYGRLMINDYALQLQLEVEFLKAPEGDGWHVRLHGMLQPTRSAAGEVSPQKVANEIHLVLYLLNDDETEDVIPLNPSHESGENADLQPTLTTWFHNHVYHKDRLFLRVEDDHSPFVATYPWRVFQLHTAPLEGDDAISQGQPLDGQPLHETTSPLALRLSDTFGGRIRDRLSTEGKTRTGVENIWDVYESPALNLRTLRCQEASASIHGSDSRLTDVEEEASDRTRVDRLACGITPPSEDQNGNTNKKSKRGMNLVVMKRRYAGDFRVDISLTTRSSSSSASSSSPDLHTSTVEDLEKEELGTPPLGDYKRLSVCQATNAFRRRQKKVTEHHWKIFQSWVRDIDNDNAQAGRGRGGLYQRLAAMTLSELLGSLGYAQGQYVLVRSGHQNSVENMSVASRNVTSLLSPYTAGALYFVGSRTDEPFGRQDVTGMQLLFLVRYNKEMVKHVLHTWLLQAQDPETGFLPSRTDFNLYRRSVMPAEFRMENLTHGTPPTLLIGLRELLNEMQRKGLRVRQRRITHPKSQRKARNSEAYLSKESTSDLQFLREILPHLKQWRTWWHQTQCGGVTDALARGCDAASDNTSPSSIRKSNENNSVLKDPRSSSPRRRALEQWPVRPTGKPEDQLAYRWRSRSGASDLPSSGMEDYPRPTCPGHEHRELHVDLFSWIAALSHLISVIEVDFLGLDESVTVDWEAHLEALHWDEQHHRYAERIGCPSSSSDPTAPPDFSPHVGFVNVFPVALGVVRRQLAHVFQTMELAVNHLQADKGLQSLSFASVRAMRESGLTHHNLFTGTIWPWQNVLYAYTLKSFYGNPEAASRLGGPTADEEAVKGLQTVARREYARLRRDVLPPLLQVTRWWEAFNPVTGEGMGGKTYIGSRALLLALLNDFN